MRAPSCPTPLPHTHAVLAVCVARGPDSRLFYSISHLVGAAAHTEKERRQLHPYSKDWWFVCVVRDRSERERRLKE